MKRQLSWKRAQARAVEDAYTVSKKNAKARPERVGEQGLPCLRS